MARALILLWLLGASLRLTVLALPPALPSIIPALGIGPAGIGLLAALPTLVFALVAIPGALLVARLGLLPTLLAGLLVAAAGAIGRGLADGLAGLATASLVMCFGIAIMQPAMPALVRAWAPSRIGLATAIYSNGLLVGEWLPTEFVPQWPLPGLGAAWRVELAIWGAPLLATALLLACLGRRPPALSRAPWWPDWRSRRVWQLGLLLAGGNVGYFGLNGFLPFWLVAHGTPEMARPALVALNGAQIPTSLLLIVFAGRLVGRPVTYVGSALTLIGCAAGIVLLPGHSVGFAAVAGCAGSVLLVAGFALPSLVAPPEDVARLSAAMFTIGYGLAMTLSLAGGALAGVAHAPALAFLPIGLACATTALVGLTIRVPRSASAPSPAPLPRPAPGG